MSKHSRRVVSGNIYDRFGRIIEGLIDNGDTRQQESAPVLIARAS